MQPLRARYVIDIDDRQLHRVVTVVGWCDAGVLELLSWPFAISAVQTSNGWGSSLGVSDEDGLTEERGDKVDDQ